jgi:hypothetical protein
MPGRVRTSPCGWSSKPGARTTLIGSALACYGVLWQQGTPADPDRSQMWLRFVTGRPVSAITTQFLEWCCQGLLKQGKTHWLLIWDNARLSQEPGGADLDP